MKIKCEIIGLAHTGTHYTVVLEDLTVNKVKIAILISEGSATEYSAIKSGYDLPMLVKLLNASKLTIEEIYVNKLLAGIFESEIKLSNGETITSNISDSLVLAEATGCDIFIIESIMKEVGIKIKDDNSLDDSVVEYSDDDKVEELTSIEELQKQLEDAISEENYERAAEIKLDIDKQK
jgi:uncharacterized protein